jgi:signal transduction histidine kinase
MERRINELGGSMRIESSREGGTRIFFIGRF